MKPNRKTCVRWDTPGHAHFLTFSCFRRQPLLNRDRTRNWLIEALNAARQTHNLDIWAYVIMPEHAHVLVFPKTAPYKVSKILATVKLPVTRKALSFVKKEAPAFLNELLDLQPDGSRHYRFWQRGGGYDRNIVEPDTTWLAIEYIHANPIRRGLCDKAQEWQWSSAGDYLGIPGPIPINPKSIPTI